MNNQLMGSNLECLSTEIAKRVPEMAQDGVINNSDLIKNMIGEEFEKALREGIQRATEEQQQTYRAQHTKLIMLALYIGALALAAGAIVVLCKIIQANMLWELAAASFLSVALAVCAIILLFYTPEDK